MVANDLKVQIAVSKQLQRALHDPSQETRVFLKKYIFIHFLTTNSQLALALRCACASSHIT